MTEPTNTLAHWITPAGSGATFRSHWVAAPDHSVRGVRAHTTYVGLAYPPECSVCNPRVLTARLGRVGPHIGVAEVRVHRLFWDPEGPSHPDRGQMTAVHQAVHGHLGHSHHR